MKGLLILLPLLMLIYACADPISENKDYYNWKHYDSRVSLDIGIYSDPATLTDNELLQGCDNIKKGEIDSNALLDKFDDEMIERWSLEIGSTPCRFYWNAYQKYEPYIYKVWAAESD